GEIATLSTPLVWPVSVNFDFVTVTSLPSFAGSGMSQIRAKLSRPPLTIVLPSLDTATESPQLVCSLRVAYGLNSAGFVLSSAGTGASGTSQTFTVLSSAAEAIRLPSEV